MFPHKIIPNFILINIANKHHHIKAVSSNFHLNGHTRECTWRLEQHDTAQFTVQYDNTTRGFYDVYTNVWTAFNTTKSRFYCSGVKYAYVLQLNIAFHKTAMPSIVNSWFSLVFVYKYFLHITQIQWNPIYPLTFIWMDTRGYTEGYTES